MSIHTPHIAVEITGTLLAGALILSANAQTTKNPMFRDCGIAANTAEGRGVVCVTLDDRRNVVVAVALDTGPTGFLVQTDLNTGVTKQVPCPPQVPQRGTFGSLISTNKHFYTAQGNTLLEYDPASEQWTYFGTPEPELAHYMSFTDEPGGKRIWAAGYPTCHLISFDPQSKKAVVHGRFDKSEQYPQSLAVDDEGWVYAGIGTARCNLVGYDPKTNEFRQLIPETDRKHGTAVVFRCKDGTVRGIANGRHYRIRAGKIDPIDDVGKASPKEASGSVYYGRISGTFDDDTRLLRYGMPEKTMTVKRPDGNEETLTFEYQSSGAQLTSLCNGPDNTVYASSCHPMHLARLDTTSGKLVDLGGIPAIGGGNFCAMACSGTTLFGAEYAGGRLWAYDTQQEWRPGRHGRQTLGIPAAKLVADGHAENGHFTYLTSEDLAFLCGDNFDAVGHFTLNVQKSGDYYLQVLPFHYPTYCDMQLLFDGKPQGARLKLSGGQGPGQTLTFGPFALDAGAHKLTMAVVETPGQKPWCSIMTAGLFPTPHESLLKEKLGNPRILAQWKKDICRPRTILKHPTENGVIMAGFAGYGFCGGGLGCYNLTDNQPTLLTAENDLLPGHSCITLKALPNGNLVGGTSVTAPGGGHATATEARIFILDWKTHKVVFDNVPVPKEANIISIETAGNNVIGLTAGGHFFVFDSQTREIIHRDRMNAYGSVPRHAFQKTPDGAIYAMLSKGIFKLDCESWTFTHLGTPPQPITAGGACVNGQLVYAGGAHVWTFSIPTAP